MNKDKWIIRSYIFLGIIFFIIIFIVFYPWKLESSVVLNHYHLLKDTIQSSIDTENHYINHIEIPKNVTLNVKYNDDQTTSIQATYIYSDYIAPKIEYNLLLSQNFEIIDASSEELSLFHYTLYTVFWILVASFISSILLPLPIIFLFCLIWDLVTFIRKKTWKIKLHINT